VEFAECLWYDERRVVTWVSCRESDNHSDCMTSLQDKEGCLPVKLTESGKECEECLEDGVYPWWYNVDFIGYSINLPLNESSVRNLKVADRIDSKLIVEVLEASENRETGIFAEFADLLPDRKLEEVVLCAQCASKHFFTVYCEEICQLWDIASALERKIELDNKFYDRRWRRIKVTKNRVKCLRFSDIPWPVQDADRITSPSQLDKSAVRRLLFSKCVIEKNMYRNGLLPDELLVSYKRLWNPKVFQRLLPSHGSKLSRLMMDSLSKERAAILEGVRIIQNYLRDFEYENWEVVLNDNPSKAQWLYSPRFRIRPDAKWDTGVFQPERWPRKDKPKENSPLLGIGLCLAFEAVLFTGFLQHVQSV